MLKKITGGVFAVILSALFLPLLSPPNVFAQYGAGIQGTVTDTTGAVISGAKVTITNEETNVKHQATTSSSGYYSVTALPPGRYSVSANLSGFAPASYTNVQVSAESVKGLNITLHPGALKQKVTVTAQAAPALQTTNGTLSGTISSREITQLPEYGRDPYNLLRLTPGVFGDASRQANGNSNLLPNTAGPGGSNASIFQTENMVQISSAGQRISDNNYLLDGVSANSLTWGGAAVLTPNESSVKAVKVVTNGYSAIYGRNSGATVEVISKNGTNQFHGSGFFKYDDPGLNAYNKYNGVDSVPARVNDATRQFGGSLGGPIIKNKLFFFGSYEGMRDNAGGVANEYVFTPQFVQQVISQRPNSITAKIFQSPGFKPRILHVLPQSCNIGFPAGLCQVVPGGLDLGSLAGQQNFFSATAPYGNPAAYVNDFNTSTGGGFDGIPDIQFVQVAVPKTLRGNQFNFRMDYNPTERDTISGITYVTLFNNTGADAAAGSQPMADVNLKPTNSVSTLLWNHIFSPTILNQARANVTRYAYNQVQSNPQVNWGIPWVKVQGLPFGEMDIGPAWSPNTPGIEAENTFDVSDMVNQVVGNKTFKYGVDIIKEQSNNNLLGGARPGMVFQYLWNLANDAPIFEEIEANPVTGLPTTGQRYFRTSDYALFFQTDWKLRSNLTVNLGLRWEDFTPLSETRGRLANFSFNSQGQVAKVEPTSQLYKPDYNNFGPRFGFAWSPKMFHDKMVWRGGFGVFYNRLPEQVFDNIRQDPPFTALIDACCGTSGSPNANGTLMYALGTAKSPSSYPPNPNWAAGIDPATGSLKGIPVQIYGAFQNTPNPYVEEWSVGYEYAFSPTWQWSMNYVGSAGHKVGRLVNLNYLYTQPAGNPFAGGVFALIPDVNTSYNALVTSLKHQFSKGLFLTVNYRWGKSIDENSWQGPCFCTNETYPQSLKSERGPSDYDVTHNVTAAAVYELPFLKNSNALLRNILGGWELDPIFTYHSGYPWTPVSGQSVQTPGGPTLSPTRPIQYFNNALRDTSNQAFIRPGGNFPGGGNIYFNYSKSGPPGVGRNSFRGPHYFDTDLSFAKNTKLPGVFHLGEQANLQIRANFFNVFNTENLASFGFGSPSTHVDNPTFLGRATAGLAGRVVELQGRISF